MRTRTLFAASAAAVAIAAAGVVGIASADGPATPANRTITVMGDANLAVNCDKKGGGDAEAVYREALAQALVEAQDKAGFIAGKVGGTLGATQSVTENSSAGDPCATPIVYADPAATVTDAPTAVGGGSTPSAGSGGSAPSAGSGVSTSSSGDMPVPEATATAPDIMVKPVPQPDPQVWASVTVTYVIG